MFRVGAAAVVCAAVSVGVMAQSPPAEPMMIPYPSLDETAITPASDFIAPPGANAPLVAAQPAATTSIPLPAGVYVGLVGLASAAIARRRYLKRR